MQQLGSFSSGKDVVPIMGTENIQLIRETEWNVKELGILSQTIAIWKGDRTPEYAFSFTLFASALGDEPSYATDKLMEALRLMNSWVAHRDGNKHPPEVTLTVGDYIRSKGVFRRVNTQLNGPWYQGKPSSIKFDGQFLFLPGYSSDAQGVDLIINSKKMSSESIKDRFYAVSA